MCFGKTKIPSPKKLPPPPEKLDTMADALRNTAAQRRGGTTRADTKAAGDNPGFTPVYTPAAGGKTLLGS